MSVDNSDKRVRRSKFGYTPDYKIDYPEKAKHLIKRGLTELEARKIMEITASTWNAYKTKYPEFKKAIAEGKAKSKSPVKAGPNVILTDEFLLRAYRLSLMGLTDKELANILLISIATLNNYKRYYKEFRDAVMNGRTLADSIVAHTYYQLATGFFHEEEVVTIVKVRDKNGREKPISIKTMIKKYYPPNEKAAKFWLKNRTRHHAQPWQDIRQHELTGKDGGKILLNQQLDLSSLEVEELEALKRMAPKMITRTATEQEN